MKQKITHFLQWLGLTLLLLNVVPLLAANWFIYQPPRPLVGYQPSLTLTTATGQIIGAEYFAHDDAQWTILYSHGNATDLGRLQGVLKTLHAQGYNVLAYEYPGYGGSTGKPNESETYAAGKAAYQYLVQQQGIKPSKIILLGRSLGSGPAVELARQYQAGGIILLSPILSAYRIITYWPLLLFDRYNNAAKITEITMPLLIIHGDSDMVVPIWHGRKLLSLANEPKDALWLIGYDHNNIFSSPELIPKINEFIAGLLENH